MEQREWDAMEQKILDAESELEEASAAMQDPEGMSDPAVVQHNSGMFQGLAASN